jgi:hypothetical protein
MSDNQRYDGDHYEERYPPSYPPRYGGNPGAGHTYGFGKIKRSRILKNRAGINRVRYNLRMRKIEHPE